MSGTSSVVKSNSVSISNTNLPVVEYEGQRVVTFAMVDKVHQRPCGTASRNYRKNRPKFIEEKQ